MARVKISEYSAKNLLLESYSGLAANLSTTAKQISQTFPADNLVLKVDQGIKKRGKLGLVKVNITPRDIETLIKEWGNLGWSNFLIEPVLEHDSSVERYLAIERVRSGWQISYSHKGGIEVETSWDSVTTTILNLQGQALKEGSPGSDIFHGREGQTIKGFIDDIIPLMEKNHLVFLEMNPVLLRGDKVIPLDMACEADSSGSSLESIADRAASSSEMAVAILDAATPASLKFKLINEKGAIWMLLSGGGASLVLADEVADQGMGLELANYGEYSGAPKSDDVYSYTRIILKELLHSSKSKRKAIVIAGGVANFTDVAQTFKGIIQALDEQKIALVKAGVKVFVRRGGPNEKKGLSLMENFLKNSNLLGSVHGHDVALTEVIREVKEYL